MATMTLTKFTKNGDGSVSLTYAFNGSPPIYGLTFPSLEDVETFLDPTLKPEATTVLQMLLAWWAARSPGFTNTNLIVGKTFTVDFSDPAPLKVQ